MIRSIVDDKAMREVEGMSLPASNVEIEAAFEEFRLALRHAHERGSITSMRQAIASYDRFAAIITAVAG